MQTIEGRCSVVGCERISIEWRANFIELKPPKGEEKWKHFAQTGYTRLCQEHADQEVRAVATKPR